MKKLTTKQRAKIYREAAASVNKNNWDLGLCYRLLDIAFFETFLYSDRALDFFPEFALFKPKKSEGGSLWWYNSKAVKEMIGIRITCALLCEQMALNP